MGVYSTEAVVYGEPNLTTNLVGWAFYLLHIHQCFFFLILQIYALVSQENIIALS